MLTWFPQPERMSPLCNVHYESNLLSSYCFNCFSHLGFNVMKPHRFPHPLQMSAHILSAIMIRSEAVVYVSHSDASLQNHVSTRAPDCVINLYHDIKVRLGGCGMAQQLAKGIDVFNTLACTCAEMWEHSMCLKNKSELYSRIPDSHYPRRRQLTRSSH